MNTPDTTIRPFFDVLRLADGRGPYWSARDLQAALGYDQWRRFEDAIERASAAISNSGVTATDHIAGADKMVGIGSSATRLVADYRLTKYGAYMVAMNGDPRKAEIAAAQTYFAVRTHEAESSALALDPTSIEGVSLILAAANTAMAKVRELEPKAEAWDELASAEGDLDVGEAAKILARAGIVTGPQRLFVQLAAQGRIFRAGHGRWEPYASAVDRGYLVARPMKHVHPKTKVEVLDPPQVRVTMKGVDRLRILLTAPKAVTS